MFVILDTNVLIDLNKGNDRIAKEISEIISGVPDPEPAISWANYFEYRFGDESETGKRFLSEFIFLEMDKRATECFTELKRKTKNASDFDLITASVALANNAVLITRDKDFEKIKGLRLRLVS